MSKKDINDLFMWVNDEEENILISTNKDIKNLKIKGNRNTIVNLKGVDFGNSAVAIGYGATCIMETPNSQDDDNH